MPAPVCLVSGTWGRMTKSSDPGSYTWWKPGSVFIANLEAAGLVLVDKKDYFDWSTAYDGLIGRNDDWETSGKALYWWWAAHGRPALSAILHSHAAQVWAYALRYSILMDTPMYSKHTVTLGSPVREDMQPIWDEVAELMEDWTHIYTEEVVNLLDGDLGYQHLGSLPETKKFPFTRKMPQAKRNIEITPACTHHWLANARLWLDNDLYQYLKP
jgi:hypothetical protein